MHGLEMGQGKGYDKEQRSNFHVEISEDTPFWTFSALDRSANWVEL